MITSEDVESLAKLARIDVPASEKAKLAKDLESILGYVSELKEAKTAEVDPAVDNYLPKNVWRSDGSAHEPEVFTKDLLEAAPDRKDNFVKVKKIL